MSGLAVFFRDDLKKNKTHHDADADADAGVDDNDSAPDELDAAAYDQCIALFHDSLSGDDGGEEEEKDGILMETPEQQRKTETEELLNYLKKRVEENDGDGADQGETEDADATDAWSSPLRQPQPDARREEHQEDNDEPETQQNEPAPPPSEKDANYASAKRKGIPAVPHVAETSGTVFNVNEINLFAEQIQLNLCSVEKVLHFRDTTRNKNHPTQLPESFQNDGPLNPIYKKVLSIEIRQLSEPPATELRQRVEQLHNINPNHTIKVFFYNKYAKRLHRLQELVQAEKKSRAKCKLQLYMALRSIPAKCVLPNYRNSCGWYDRTMYSLCIGDRSRVSFSRDDDDGEKEHLRFDRDDDMRIYFLLVDRGTPIAEYRIYAAPGNSGDVNIFTAKIDGQSPIQMSFQNLVGDNLEETIDESDTAIDDISDEEPAAANEKGNEPRHPESGKNDTTSTTRAAAPQNGKKTSKARRAADEGGGRKRPRTNGKKRQYEVISYFPHLLKMESDLHCSTSTENARRRIDTFGVALSFTQPSITTRGQWTMSVVLVDEGLKLYENEVEKTDPYINSITCNFFAHFRDKDALPKVRYAGDVLRLHGVILNSWHGNIQLTGFPREATTVVFRGIVNDPDATKELTVFPSAHADVVTEEDKGKALELWKWAQDRLRIHATMKREHSFNISDMGPQNSTTTEMHGESLHHGDLTAMVAAVLPIDQEPDAQNLTIPPRGFLRVWDGTGPPTSDQLPIDTPAAREAVRTGEPPAAALVRLTGVIKKIQKYHKNPHLGAPKRLTGRVATVAVYDKQYWNLIHEGIVTVGSFIRLRNISESKLEHYGSCLVVSIKSSFTPLPDLTFEVVRLLEDHNNRLLRQDPINPDSGILPLGAEGDLECVGAAQNGRSEPSNRWSKSSTANTARKRPPTRSLGTTGTVARNGTVRAPRHCQNLREVKWAPVGSSFDGYIRIVGIYPSKTYLSAQGLKQIIWKKQNAPSGDDRFYRFGVQVEDEARSELVDVIVSEASEDAGSLIFGMSASSALANNDGAMWNLERLLDEKAFWEARVRSYASGGEKYFSLDHLAESS